MKGNTMRKLVDRNGNFVPTNKAYGDAFKGMGKSLALYFVGAVVLNIWGRSQEKKHEALMKDILK
jgi:hypothetical protein